MKKEILYIGDCLTVYVIGGIEKVVTKTFIPQLVEKRFRKVVIELGNKCFVPNTNYFKKLNSPPCKHLWEIKSYAWRYFCFYDKNQVVIFDSMKKDKNKFHQKIYKEKCTKMKYLELE